MKPSLLSALAVIMAMPVLAEAGPPVIQSGSLVRVRADNRFGVAKQHDVTPAFGLALTDTIVDTEVGTSATATTSATYNITLSGGTATFAINAQQSFSQGAHNNLTEGFIQFTIDEPYQFELTGNFTGAGTDVNDGYQQRTFLRFFQTPFSTIYLEDETGFGSAVSLAVNQRNDSAGGLFNQFGPATGILNPGTYEFMYELEGRDDDVDGAGTSMSNGSVRLILRPPVPPASPANLTAQVNGLTVSLAWTGSAGASSYQLEAGTAAGLANVFSGDIGNVTTLQAQGSPGTFFVRVRARNAFGPSAASNEVQVTLGSGPCTAPPPAPGGLTFRRAGNLLVLSWIGSPGAAAYQLQAGTAFGLNNAFDGDVGIGTTQQFDVSGVPAATYFVRVRARNVCGLSGPSNEVPIPLP